MIIVMKTDTPNLEVERIIQELQSDSITPEKIVGKHKVIIGLEEILRLAILNKYNN